MRLSISPSLLVLTSVAVQLIAGERWTYTDGAITVSTKGNTDAASRKDTFSPGSPVSEPISLSGKDTIKFSISSKDGSSSKRPHQAFLLVGDVKANLETFFPFTMKESGKGRVDIGQKDIPSALLQHDAPLDVSLVLSSFGSSKPLIERIAKISPVLDTQAKSGLEAASLRYGKLGEIHHVFREEPRSPPKIITLVFLIAVLIQLPALFIGWLGIGANTSAMPSALGNAPLAHPVFFASLLAMEGVFAAYYVKISLFQTLAAAAVVAPVAFLSGSRALREVRARRLAGKR